MAISLNITRLGIRLLIRDGERAVHFSSRALLESKPVRRIAVSMSFHAPVDVVFRAAKPRFSNYLSQRRHGTRVPSFYSRT
jgi:hypothetical protein